MSALAEHGSNFNEPFDRPEKDADDLDSRLVKMVRSFMARSREYRETHIERALESRQMYECWQSSGRSLIQRANLKLPFGFTVIETQLPQLTDVFLQDQHILSFKGQDEVDAQFEDSLTDFHRHQFEEMQFDTKFINFVKSMMLDGIGIAKVPYRYEERLSFKRTQKRDQETGELFFSKEPSVEVAFDGPDFEVVPIEDFFPDWTVKNPGDVKAMRGVVHRMTRTFSALKARERRVDKDGNVEGVYRNLDRVKTSVRVKGSKAWAPPFFSDKYRWDFDYNRDNKQGIKELDQLEIWEYWGLFDPKGDGNFEEYVITVANGDVVIRADKNFYDDKFKPFVACPNIIRDNEFYGVPELLPVRSLIKEANAIRNARLDNINLSVNPMYVVDKNGGIDINNIFSRPNGVIPANDINAIKRLETGDPSIGSAQEMISIQQDIQSATASIASTPQLSQMTKTLGRSATGVEFMQQAGTSRVGLKARLLADLVFKPMGWMLLRTNRQFVDQDKWVRVINPDAPNPYELLPRDSFSRQYDIIINSNLDDGGPAGQAAKMQSVAQVAQAIEASQPGSIKMEVMGEALLRPLLGAQTPRFMRSEEEMQLLAMQRQMQQQQLNAAQGQGAPQPNAGPGVAPLSGGFQ